MLIEYLPGVHTPVQSNREVEPVWRVIDRSVGHRMHTESDVAPIAAEYVPAGQFIHVWKPCPVALPEEA